MENHKNALIFIFAEKSTKLFLQHQIIQQFVRENEKFAIEKYELEYKTCFYKRQFLHRNLTFP